MHIRSRLVLHLIISLALILCIGLFIVMNQYFSHVRWPNLSAVLLPSSTTTPFSNDLTALSSLSSSIKPAGAAGAAGVVQSHGPKLPGEPYSRTLVIGRTSSENVSWITTDLLSSLANDDTDDTLSLAIYVADDPTAPLHPPRNKGHEVMIYLTYIIDHYDSLPDIVLFMHAHRWSYHNNELQDMDAMQMIRGLNHARVVREGYMNLRCRWDPGCPEHLHPLSPEPDYHRLQAVVAQQWPLIFSSSSPPYFPLPNNHNKNNNDSHDPSVSVQGGNSTMTIPETLAQPCCAQFALSRQRILSIPRSSFIAYREWLLHTPLTDYYSGRIWEYLWQYLFSNGRSPVLCLPEHVCYCDGYGICFGGELEYADYWALVDRKKSIVEHHASNSSRDGSDGGSNGTNGGGGGDDGREKEELNRLEEELSTRLEAAKKRGAREVGRQWKLGDEF